MVMVWPILLGAQETVGPKEEPETALIEVDPWVEFSTALHAARADRAAKIAAAQAKYDRTASALRSASASLTAEARKRLDEGPLAEARMALQESRVVAERRFADAVEAAVVNCGSSAVMVFSAASETVAALGTEHEVYVAVVGAADEALGLGEASSHVARQRGERAQVEYQAAEAALTEARRRYDAAVSERDTASKVSPAEPKPDHASNILGGLTAGLAEAVGDRDKASAIRGQLDRERSDRLDEHAASVERYESRLAEATEAVETAGEVLDAVTRRFNAASTQVRSAHAGSSSADAAYSAAYEARVAAGIDAAGVTRVHSADELEAVAGAIRDGALSAIAEMTFAALDRLTKDTVVQVLESALTEYARPRAAAIEASLTKTDEEYRDSVESAESRYEAQIARARTVVDELKQAVVSHNGEYLSTVQAADEALEDAVVEFYSRGPDGRYKSKVRAGRERAEAAHRRAVASALENREFAVARDVPAIRGTFSALEGRCYESPDPRIYGGSWDSGSVVSATRRYRTARSRADAELGGCVARAYIESTEIAAMSALGSVQERAEAERAAARSDLVARVIAADKGQAERLRTLEAAIPARLFPAAQ